MFPTGDVRVAVNGRVWTFNPQAMVAAPDENPPEVPGTVERIYFVGINFAEIPLERFSRI